MGGMSLGDAEVGMRGLQHDRRYMLVSAEGKFLTQRQTPELGQFQLAYNADQTDFMVTFQGDTLDIPLSLDPKKMLRVRPTYGMIPLKCYQRHPTSINGFL